MREHVRSPRNLAYAETLRVRLEAAPTEIQVDEKCLLTVYPGCDKLSPVELALPHSEVRSQTTQRKDGTMETTQADTQCEENTKAEVPSADFICAVAELLETDADDILAELGYIHDETMSAPAAELR